MEGTSHRAAYLWDLTRELVVRDLKLRYKRSVLGIGWSLLNPLLQFAVFYVVFRWIVPVNIPDFAVFLLTGILAWNWFQHSLSYGCTAITDNAALLRQPGFPAAMLPVVTVASNLVNFVLALPILILALFAFGHPPTAAVAFVPLVIVVQFVLTLGLVYVLCAVHVTYRDTQYILGVLLTLAFFASPVFYSIASVPAAWRAWYSLNPLVPLLESYRAALVDGRAPDVAALAGVGVLAVAMLAFGYFVFVRSSRDFLEEIGT